MKLVSSNSISYCIETSSYTSRTFYIYIQMFDPLSALACIGFATGTLSFLVTTLSKIDERIDEIKECGSRLLAHKLQLEEGRHKIDTWLRVWRGRHAFDDEVYRFFWGSPAFEEI